MKRGIIYDLQAEIPACMLTKNFQAGMNPDTVFLAPDQLEPVYVSGQPIVPGLEYEESSQYDLKAGPSWCRGLWQRITQEPRTVSPAEIQDLLRESSLNNREARLGHIVVAMPRRAALPQWRLGFTRPVPAPPEQPLATAFQEATRPSTRRGVTTLLRLFLG